MKYINVYELDRVYGGPEEGGWYYDTGRFTRELSSEIRDSVPDLVVHQKAVELRTRLLAEAHAYNTPPVGSVRYRGGRFSVRIEDHPGRDFPIERPTYQ